MPNESSYGDFKALVNSDVRNETSPEEGDWLRSDDQIIRFWTELTRLESTVTSQMANSEAAVRAHPEGSQRRLQEEQKRAASESSRIYYRERVRDRIAEVVDLYGYEPVGTVGSIRLYVDAALDALDDNQSHKATKFLESLLDVLDPPSASEAG